jgi:DNA polymerase (family 10)
MIDNAQIADALLELADLLEIQRRPVYQTRAFRNAAIAIEGLDRPASELLAEGRLTEVPGIGAGVERRVSELLRTGELAELVELRTQTPRGLAEIMRIDGVGPKLADVLWKQLGVTSLEALEAAARDGRLRALPRFSEKKEQRILAGIEAHRRRQERRRLPKAWPMAELLLSQAATMPGVIRVELVGPMRRHEEMIDGIDLVAAARFPDSARVLEAFTRLGPARERLDGRRAPDTGWPSVCVRLRDGLVAELHVADPAHFGTAQYVLTGSTAHLTALAAHTGGRALPLVSTEEALFDLFDLPFIEPELREGRGEVQAAAQGRLPRLLRAEDLRGDLHMHTVETDGRATLDEMVAAAADLGLEYIAITDHSQALAFARGLDAARLRAQGRQITEMNERTGGRPIVLRGIECDILADGTMDLGPDVLRELDWVVGSVHSQFRLPRAEQTRRVVKALESGLVDVLGHPTGRRLGHRDPYDIDLEAVLDAARRVGCAVELNAYPERLDLNDEHVKLAKEMGVPVVLSTDSHATHHLGQNRWGVMTARRGWLGPDDVANTRPAREFLELFSRRRLKRG